MDGDLGRRFWVKVNRGPGCWEWLAGRTSRGHGAFKVGGRLERALRDWSSMKISTYNRLSKTVSTLKKSQARMLLPC